MKKLSARFAGSLAALISLLGCDGSGAAVPATEQHADSLGFVRFKGSPARISQLREAAASVGWTQATIDPHGRLLVKVPTDYSPDRFEQLLHALEDVSPRDWGLQLLLADGRLIDGNGNRVAEK